MRERMLRNRLAPTAAAEFSVTASFSDKAAITMACANIARLESKKAEQRMPTGAPCPALD
jgi:hypothetical protein